MGFWKRLHVELKFNIYQRFLSVQRNMFSYLDVAVLAGNFFVFVENARRNE